MWSEDFRLTSLVRSQLTAEVSRLALGLVVVCSLIGFGLVVGYSESLFARRHSRRLLRRRSADLLRAVREISGCSRSPSREAKLLYRFRRSLKLRAFSGILKACSYHHCRKRTERNSYRTELTGRWQF